MPWLTRAWRDTLEASVYWGAGAVTVAGALLDRPSWQRLAKPLIAPSLAVRLLRTREAPLLVFGLAAATVGDAYLIDPDDDARLQRGAGCFAATQLAYAVHWQRRGARATAWAALPRAAGWAGATALLRRRAPELALPLAGYGLTLGAATTLASDPRLPWQPRLGALLFTLSDAVIVLRRLLLVDPRVRRYAEGFVLCTYVAAQYLLTTPPASRPA
jgi:uncharacterized membrane protein YhhN